MTGNVNDISKNEGGSSRPRNPSQFRKGQSGNPKGRPIKPKLPSPAYNPADYPTRKIIRDEAQRAVAIRDGDERREIPSSQAVMMALANAAMKGGVLAQRTYLSLQMAEDERRKVEPQENFNFWSNWKREGQAQIDAAIAASLEPPDILPHPADISLYYSTLNVEFSGALNRADREDEERRARLRDLLLELVIYTGEDNFAVPGNNDASTIGLYLSSYIVVENNLPPSLQRRYEDVARDATAKAATGRYRWSLDLEKRCEAAKIPFKYTRQGQQTSRSIPLRKLGFGWVDGKIEPVDPKLVKKRDKMMALLSN